MPTDEEYKQLNHISDKEILKDIKDTEQEIENLEKRLSTYTPQNGGQEKVDHFMTDGKIRKRKDFVNRLNKLLECRKKNGVSI